MKRVSFLVTSALFLGVVAAVLIGLQKRIQDARPAGGFSFLIQGLEPLRDNRAHRWADINMIVEDAGDHVKIISFPRDTLVEIPGRGMWLLNAIYYNLDTVGRGRAWEWFSSNIRPGLQGQIAVTAEQIGILVDALQVYKDHPVLAELTRDYGYIDDWIRHRDKLGMEYLRQVRIHAFIDYLVKVLRRNPLPATFLKKILAGAVLLVEGSDFTAEELEKIYLTIMDKEIRFYIWPGEYRPVTFNYSWYADTHYCYILDDAADLREYRPHFVYTTNDFFMKEGRGPRIRVNTNNYANYKDFK